MTDAQAALLAELASLLAEPEHGAKTSSLEHIEETLTAGYARALEIEAERWRLERQIGEVTSRLGDGDREGTGANELAALAREATRADGDLRRLRSLLASLRTRASALRAAAATLPL